LKAQGYTLGVIFFDYTEVNEIISEDVYLAKLIAGLTAQALVNAEYQSIKDLKELRAITTLKLQENNLKEITDSVSRLSHVFLDRAILARNRLDLAMREQATPEEIRNYILIARGHIEHLRKVTEYILDYSKLKAEGRTDELIELSEVIIEIVAQYQAEATTQTIELSCVSEGTLPLVKFNPNFALMILGNLLSNALKHTPANGKIEVRYYHYQTKIYISVKDSGAGMNEETKRKLFSVPFLGSNQPNNAIKGTGLGLYFSNQLLESVNGRIWVEESIPGQGSTITFELPIAEVAPTSILSAS